MTGLEQLAAVPTLIARLLTEPDLLDALDRRDMTVLRRDLTVEPALLTVVCGLDVAGLRHYLRILQHKRLEVIEPIFSASLPAARDHYGVDGLAAGFWQWYQQPATVAVHDVHADIATAWTGYAGHLADRGQFGWLGDLTRYELMRWRAVFYSVAPPDDHCEGDRSRRTRTQPAAGMSRPELIPGASAALFAFDVPVLLKSLLEGGSPPPRRATRLITWYRPGRVSTLRLGTGAYAALLACDGSRTVDQIAAAVSADATVGGARVAMLVRELVQAGALRLVCDGEARASE